MILSKEFDAPRTLVFEMFKNPEHLASWWGPTGMPATIVSFDFSPGGVWHYYMQGPDGTKYWGKATFKEIDEPNSLSYIDVFSDEAGTVNPDLPQGLTLVTFDEHDGKTTLRMVGEYQNAEEIEKLTEMGMIEGVTDTWNQLEALIEKHKTL